MTPPQGNELKTDIKTEIKHTHGPAIWWGRHSTAQDRTDFWQVGPLRLWLHSSPSRMSLRWISVGDFLDGHSRSVPGSLDASGNAIEIPSNAESVICAFAHQPRADVVLSPSMPDRPVVVRLRQAVGILPGEEVTFYMTVPLSVKIELQTDIPKLLHEIPAFRLSDTWFGPMSMIGQLCYSSPADLYLDIRQIPLRPHCVTTAITIRNAGLDTLQLERLNIPFPRLSLFFSQQSGFWTDRVTLERREDDEMAYIKIDKQPPAEASPTQFVSGPREVDTESISVVRAFSAIFRDRGSN